jgi:hypothetical protein
MMAWGQLIQEADMDKEVLKRQLTERCRLALDQALRAVDEAPDGQWIAASEWEVRDIFQKLTADCFGQMIQERIDRLPSASQAAFSPDGRADGPATQGKPGRAGAHRRRRD